MSQRTIFATFALIFFTVLIASPSHAALNDKKAVANAAGKYKGFWNNMSIFGTFTFPTMDGSGATEIAGQIRLKRKPKKINYTLPDDVLAPPPVTKMKVSKTIVRRGGKMIIHKGNGTQDLSMIFAPVDFMKGKGSVKLKARGKKFKATGRFNASNTAGAAAAGPDTVAGTFSGKGG